MGAKEHQNLIIIIPFLLKLQVFAEVYLEGYSIGRMDASTGIT